MDSILWPPPPQADDAKFTGARLAPDRAGMGAADAVWCRDANALGRMAAVGLRVTQRQQFPSLRLSRAGS